MASEDESATRRQFYRLRGQNVISGRVRVYDLNFVVTYEPGEADQGLYVVAAQRENACFCKKRQLFPQRRSGHRSSVHFMPAINQRARQVNQVARSATKRRHGTYLQNLHISFGGCAYECSAAE